jgi:hypothetical protein
MYRPSKVHKDQAFRRAALGPSRAALHTTGKWLFSATAIAKPPRNAGLRLHHCRRLVSMMVDVKDRRSHRR